MATLDTRRLRAERTNDRDGIGYQTTRTRGNRSTFLVSLLTFAEVFIYVRRVCATFVRQSSESKQCTNASGVTGMKVITLSLVQFITPRKIDCMRRGNKDNGTQNPILLSICVSSHRGSIHRLLTYTYKDTQRYVGRFSLSFV